MIDTLRWVLAIEVIGLAFLPLTLWMLRALPDRGYIFAKIIGLVVITYATWLIGSFLPVASSVALPLSVLVIGGSTCWWSLRAATMADLRALRKAVVIEEVLFLAAFLLWSLLRVGVFHPGIGHTEQYMDMSFLEASMHSASYPPYDPWMSGHTINYYYVGYLLFALLTKLAGVSPAVGYNLSLSFLFAFVAAGSFSLGYTLTHRLKWAGLSTLFVALVGNWHAILVQAPSHQDPGTTYYWFWSSTRVIGSNTTITEFPFFSFMLGDLHPHVMSFPLTLLVLAFGCNILLSPQPLRLHKTIKSLLPAAFLAVTIGMLFTVNSWDFPTYLLVTAACIVVGAYLGADRRGWWLQPLLAIGAVTVAAVLFYTPFYVHFQSPTHGLGWVSTPSDPLEFLQVMGVLLLPTVLFIGSLALLFQPTAEIDEQRVSPIVPRARATEAGTARAFNAMQISLYALLFLVVMVAAHFHLWVVLLMVAFAVGTLFVLHRVLLAEQPSRPDAVALVFILVACLMIVVPEIVFVRDSFDGSSSYRMNTLFKLYYQAWTLLGVVGAYAVCRGWKVLEQYFSSVYAWGAAALVAVGTLGGLYYTLNAPQSANQGGVAQSLDGSALLQQNAPGDYAAVQWLNRHTTGTPTEMEATGGEYDSKFARIATFTGLPTVMGWAGHEFQWRGPDPQIQQRVDDIKTVYTTSDIPRARALLQGYGVRYVIVGPTEQQTYPGPGLTKFARFMHTAFTSNGTTVYAW